MLQYTLLDGIYNLWGIGGLYGEINGSYDAIDSLYGAISDLSNLISGLLLV